MGFEWKDVASWGLAGLPKQIFESDDFKKGNSMIGKAFPNEISEYANETQNIPILGWLMSGLAATDMASTAYEDSGSVSKAWEAGTAGTFGKARSPGAYGAGGEREDWDSNDAFQGMLGNQVGGIGNFAGRILGENKNASQGSQQGASAAGNIFGNIDNMIQPNNEQSNTNIDVGGIANVISNLFGNNNNNGGDGMAYNEVTSNPIVLRGDLAAGDSGGSGGFDWMSLLSMIGNQGGGASQGQSSGMGGIDLSGLLQTIMQNNFSQQDKGQQTGAVPGTGSGRLIANTPVPFPRANWNPYIRQGV